MVANSMGAGTVIVKERPSRLCISWRRCYVLVGQLLFNSRPTLYRHPSQKHRFFLFILI
uniref:Uncharacterized protein n=1 Tax=Octopus bimaculoides TaxID=37653 RepID=A0A0L8GWC7_OCTBM